MRKIISISLLLVLIIQLSTGVLTILKFQLNRDYIAANLCERKAYDFKAQICAGSCFLKKELTKQQKENTPQKSKSEIQLDVVYVQLKNDFRSDLQIIELDNSKGFHLDFSPFTLTQEIFHPPC